MSLSNAFVPGNDFIYCETLTSFTTVRTPYLDQTDPDPLLIGSNVATQIELGNAGLPIPVLVNGFPITSGSGVIPIEYSVPTTVATISTGVINSSTERGVAASTPGEFTQIQLYIVGKLVTLYMPAWTMDVSLGSNPGDIINLSGVIPLEYRPQYDVMFFDLNSTTAPNSPYVNTSGDIIVLPYYSATPAVNGFVSDTTLSWIIA